MTGTQTTTYTVVDIRKVVDKFAADFAMIVQATGIHDRNYVSKVVCDLKIFAEYAYLEKVNLILKDASGTRIRAAVYNVAESAVGWKSDRPGNNLWPRTPGGNLLIIVMTSNTWNEKMPAEKQTFITQKMNLSWPTGTEDTSFAEMKISAGQKYESNTYGWERTNFTL